MNLGAFLRLLLTGHSIASQDDDNRFNLETYKRLPENKREGYKRKWISFIRKNSIEENEFKAKKIWPKVLGSRIGSSENLYDIVSYLESEHELINSSIFEKIFSAKSPYYKELHLQKFGQVTRSSIENNIHFGNRIILSRVVESNARDAFTNIPQKLQEAIDNNYNPLVQLYLSPVNTLEKSAKNEADDLSYLLSKGCPKDIILNKERGISPIYQITQLRYLWLYLGTISFAYAFNKWQPKHFYLHYGNETPSARCTLIEEKSPDKQVDPESDVSTLGDTFFIQMPENGVGFDGVCYKYFGESQFDHDIYKEFVSGGSLKSEGDILNYIYNDAYEIEKKVLRSHPQLVDSLKQNKFVLIDGLKHNNLKVPYIEEKEFRVPSVVDMWKEYSLTDIKTASSKKEDVVGHMNKIGACQDTIDVYLATTRKSIEGES
jgi:hypothetical protein